MMASACVNNVTFPPACQLLRPTIISPAPTDASASNPSSSAAPPADSSIISADLIDFEFPLEDPVTMLPADELFSDGKLVPLHLSTPRPSAEEIPSPCPERSNDLVFSPKAPRCTTRWRELLGFKKQPNPLPDLSKPAGSPSGKPFRHLLLRHSKPRSPIDPSSLSLPLLLRDIDSDTVASAISTRLSLSSSSSSSGLDHDHDELPRLSLDSDRARNPPLRVRIARTRPAEAEERVRARVGRSPRGASVDSPRMDPSGRIIFQGLERSSSSPGSFNGRPRGRCRGMERSFSAHVRVPSVINVPLCSRRGSLKPVSVFGFGQLFSQEARKGRVGSAAAAAGGGKKKAETERIIRARRESSGV